MKNTWVKIPVVNNFKFINKLHVAGVKYWSATQFAEFTTKYKIAKYEFYSMKDIPGNNKNFPWLKFMHFWTPFFLYKL